MKKFSLLAGFLFALALLLVSGCAKKPVEEIQKAENAVAQARQAGAEQWAPSSFRTAENKLKEAMELVNNRKYKEAVPVLEETVRLADDARQEAADAKRVAEEKKRAEEAAKQEDEPEQVGSNTHTVTRGECLWVIAGYPRIYGDPWKWQRIYNANQDKIRNPDLIYPGQVFDIPQ